MLNRMKKIFIILIISLACCNKQATSLSNHVANNISIDTSISTDIVGFNSYGQSLSDGGDGGLPNAVISTTQYYNSIMFNLGVRPLDYHAGQVPTSFAPLVEKLSGNTVMGETPCSGASDMFIQAYPQRTFQLFGCSSGQPSQTVADLSKGGQYYQRLISNTSTANTLANNIGKSFSMGAIFWTQGTADYTNGTNYDDYYNSLFQLQQDASNDIDSITGQQNSVPFLIGQSADQNRQAASMSNPTAALAQLDLAENDPNFTLATPMYLFDYLSDNTHLNDTNYRRLGAYYGYAMKKFLIDGVKNFIYPLSTQTNSNRITITFNVPVQPLVFDTDKIIDPGAYGFNALDASGNQIKIKSISLISGNAVQIICARQPSFITYAINGQSKKAGRTQGPRGCLRDSQGDSIVFDGYHLYNWCPIFKIQL